MLGPRQVDNHNLITAGGIFGSETEITQRGWKEYDHGQYNDIREDAKSVMGLSISSREGLGRTHRLCTVSIAVAGHPWGISRNPAAVATWCSYHARAHGYKVVYYGPVQMIHLWHKSSPVGRVADSHLPSSKMVFRQACPVHGLDCE